MNNKPKLRDSGQRRHTEPFQLNEVPDSIIKSIGSHLVYLLSIGRSDISGDDWGDALASAVNGQHLASPLGIALPHC